VSRASTVYLPPSHRRPGRREGVDVRNKGGGRRKDRKLREFVRRLGGIRKRGVPVQAKSGKGTSLSCRIEAKKGGICSGTWWEDPPLEG